MIGRTRSTTLSFGRNPDPANDTHMTDLGILVSELGVQALNISDQADAVIRALNDAVIHTVAVPRPAAPPVCRSTSRPSSSGSPRTTARSRR